MKTLELGLGVGALVLAVSALQAAQGVSGAPAAQAESTPRPLPGGSSRTPADDAPVPLGARFEHDAAMASAAEAVASYTLHARLDPERHEVTAKGTITWKNTSRVEARELWLHLYLNAFKNEKTLFLRSPFGAGRRASRATDWGYVDVKSLVARELGGADLWPGAARHTPGDPDDQTDIRVPLPSPVAPGAVLTLDVEFVAKLPSIVERTGFAGRYHFVAQWFPKLARREADGTWVHFPFHPQAEFYADFGRYRVTLDVPREMVVGATGRRVSERVEGGRQIAVYEAENVHDFAWTAWDDFRELSAVVDGVAVRVLYAPGHRRNAELARDTVAFALPFFSRRYGRYPYPVLTVVHPPEAGQNSGGMEYPTLITSGGAWYIGYTGVRAIEAVTVHELGHQWFYGLIATNEQAWPFLDEGLNSYAETLALSERFGKGSMVDTWALTLSVDAVRRAFAPEYAKNEPVALPAAQFASFQDLGALVYTRTAAVLRTFERVYGATALNSALARYTRAYRFGHPGPRHWLAAVADAAGPDAAAMLQTALFERGWVDYRVDTLASVPERQPAGVFDGEGDAGRTTISSGMQAPQQDRWVGQVTVRRDGNLRLPVDIELIAESGERTRRHWDGQSAWVRLDYAGSSPLVAAVVDPEQRVLLDDDLLNNAKSQVPQTPSRVFERAVYVAELLLGVVAP